jgi:hypothetical protein
MLQLLGTHPSHYLCIGSDVPGPAQSREPGQAEPLSESLGLAKPGHW